MALDIQFNPLTLEELPQCVTDHKQDGYRFVQMLCVNTDEGIDLQYTFMKGNRLENYTIPGVKKGTKVPSVTSTYISAFVFENEAHDLFGVEIEGNALDFGGKFYIVSESEPMTVITPEQKAAREKAAKIAAAKAAKAAKDAGDAPSADDAEASKARAAEQDEKIKNLDPEKAAKVKAAMEAKAAREAAKKQAAPEMGKEGE